MKIVCFFFSSRRRHTRWTGDWSSDVCSSDLIPTPESRDAVRRAMRVAFDRGSELIGIVENMVGREFVGTAADDLAKEFTIPVLARIPWHPTPDNWSTLGSQL